MPDRGPIRPFNDRQNRIAEGIRRGLSYRQIGAELGISEHTVADCVEKMAMLFDVYNELNVSLPPRHIILVYAVYCYRRLESMATNRTP
jgi:DNA-binding NarL/FixJ family response regulator